MLDENKPLSIPLPLLISIFRSLALQQTIDNFSLQPMPNERKKFQPILTWMHYNYSPGREIFKGACGSYLGRSVTSRLDSYEFCWIHIFYYWVSFIIAARWRNIRNSAIWQYSKRSRRNIETWPFHSLELGLNLKRPHSSRFKSYLFHGPVYTCTL